MPLFFLFFGFVLLVGGYRGNASPLFTQIETDGKGFLAFGLAILILGGLGISTTIRPVSKALLGLVFVVFFLSKNVSGASNGARIFDALKNVSETGSTTNTATTSTSAATASTSSTSSGSSSSSSENWGEYADDIFSLFDDA